MKKNNFSFVKGMGHIAIWPTGAYQQYLPKGSVAMRLGSHWHKVGQYLKTAVVQHEHEKSHHK